MKKSLVSIAAFLVIFACKNNSETTSQSETITKQPNDVIPFFQHWNLILGNGSNVGQATNYEDNDFFYADLLISSSIF